jgi:hypothetical protein
LIARCKCLKTVIGAYETRFDAVVVVKQRARSRNADRGWSGPMLNQKMVTNAAPAAITSLRSMSDLDLSYVVSMQTGSDDDQASTSAFGRLIGENSETSMGGDFPKDAAWTHVHEGEFSSVTG